MNKPLKAPWTRKQVESLKARQAARLHQYTCPNHPDALREVALVPTVNGWVCLNCSYTQDWAMEFDTRYKEPAP